MALTIRSSEHHYITFLLQNLSQSSVLPIRALFSKKQLNSFQKCANLLGISRYSDVLDPNPSETRFLECIWFLEICSEYAAVLSQKICQFFAFEVFFTIFSHNFYPNPWISGISFKM